VLHFAGVTPGSTGITDKKGKDSRSIHRAGKHPAASSEILDHHLLQLDPDALVVGADGDIDENLEDEAAAPPLGFVHDETFHLGAVAAVVPDECRRRRRCCAKSRGRRQWQRQR
jgi:hypothetical protein